MASNAEGGHDGVTAAGPDNKYDGVYPCENMDGQTAQDIKAGLRISQPWKLGQGAAPASGFALGANRPD